MPDIRVEGVDQLRLLGLRFKALGAAGNIGAAEGLGQEFGAGKTLRAQLLAGIRAAAKPAAEAAREAARRELPKRGGLNNLVADSQIKISTRLTGPRVGVRITDRGKGGRGANNGLVRHPVFGNRGVWRETKTPTGWFDATLEDQKDEVIPKIRAAMEVIAVEATRRL